MPDAKPLSALFDNPATMQREVWVDGHLFAFVAAELMGQLKPAALAFLYRQRSRRTRYMAELATMPWESGRVRGDVDAIAERFRPNPVAADPAAS